jgi:hypothetical protein
LVDAAATVPEAAVIVRNTTAAKRSFLMFSIKW